MAEAPTNVSFFRGLDLPARNPNTELSIAELRRYRRYDRLVLIMHFPHYYEAAKKDLMLRTMVIWEAEKYLERPIKTENMKLLCERLKAEYKKQERAITIEEHVEKISGLGGRDMCTIASRSFFMRRIIVQNSRLRSLLLAALEHEIDDDSADSPFLEYLVRCIRSNLWRN